jgi:hypothetical protein
MRAILSLLLIFLTVSATVASDQEDAAADAVVSAFAQARQAAHLPKLERMGRNKFREKVCNRDMRFASGIIRNVVYETSDPTQMPESAQRLATWPDAYQVAARFGVGVCLLNDGGQPKFSVLIATYESPWNSFLRFFD